MQCPRVSSGTWVDVPSKLIYVHEPEVSFGPMHFQLLSACVFKQVMTIQSSRKYRD